MKHIKMGVIPLLLFGIVFAFTGIVCADQGVNATPEIQSLVTTTTADVTGIVMETDAGTWTLTNDPTILYTYFYPSPGYFGNDWPAFSIFIAQIESSGGSISYTPGNGGFYINQISIPQSLLNQQFPTGGTITIQEWMDNFGFVGTAITGKGIHTGTLDPGQVQYTTAYDTNIVSQAGHTVLNKGVNINTGNKVLTQANFKAQTGITYISTGDGGNIAGSENLMIDGAGRKTNSSDRMLCPFASQPVDMIPAYCNIVQTGNSYDLVVGSVSSEMSERFVGSDATNPVVLDQTFSVKPYGTTQGQILATGSAMAYIKAHIQESRGGNTTSTLTYQNNDFTITPLPTKAEDFVYNEQSSAQGTITSFNKVIHYQSGKSLL